MKDFDALQAERLAAEPEETKADREARAFALGGKLLYRRPKISGPTIWLVGQLGGENDEATDAQLIMRILEQMIDEDSIPDFRLVMSGQATDAPAPDQETLMELMSWLMSEATGVYNALDGRLALHGAIPLEDMTMRRALNTLYAAVVESMDEEERAKFDADLEGPVTPAVDHRGRRIIRRPSQSRAVPAEAAAFMSGGAGD